MLRTILLIIGFLLIAASLYFIYIASQPRELALKTYEYEIEVVDEFGEVVKFSDLDILFENPPRAKEIIIKCREPCRVDYGYGYGRVSLNQSQYSGVVKIPVPISKEPVSVAISIGGDYYGFVFRDGRVVAESLKGSFFMKRAEVQRLAAVEVEEQVRLSLWNYTVVPMVAGICWTLGAMVIAGRGGRHGKT